MIGDVCSHLVFKHTIGTIYVHVHDGFLGNEELLSVVDGTHPEGHVDVTGTGNVDVGVRRILVYREVRLGVAGLLVAVGHDAILGGFAQNGKGRLDLVGHLNFAESDVGTIVVRGYRLNRVVLYVAAFGNPVAVVLPSGLVHVELAALRLNEIGLNGVGYGIQRRRMPVAVLPPRVAVFLHAYRNG